MNAKIEWFQEVLGIDPDSKIFFPLAQLLAAEGRYAEAIDTLHKGLERHPEYIEARLFLVQLLREHGDPVDCAAQVRQVVSYFTSYPGFLDAWSEYCATEDISLALAFLAAGLRRPGLNFRQIFAAGLKAVTQGTAGTAVTAERTSGTEKTAAEQISAERVAVRPAAASFEDARADDDVLPAADPLPARDSGRSVTVPPMYVGEPAAADFEGQDDEWQEPSLRTRSMAEVLAEQGDIREAIAIYREILARTQPGSEADALSARIAALSARLVRDEAEEAAAPAGKTQEGHAMRSLLESLADRLEARAQA